MSIGFIVCIVFCIALITTGVVILVQKRKKKHPLVFRHGQTISQFYNIADEAEKEQNKKLQDNSLDSIQEEIPASEVGSENAMKQENFENMPHREDALLSFVDLKEESDMDNSALPKNIAMENREEQALLMFETHELLLTLSDGVKKIAAAKTEEIRNERIKEMQQALKVLDVKSRWEEYRELFSKTYPGFFNKLETYSPELNPFELRLCALLALDKSTREIADLSNRSIRTIETSIYKIRKKLSIPSEAKIQDFLKNLGNDTK
ncbi:MAG: hypothetical protein RR084_02245 [Bacteroidales bacterium]